MRAGLEGRPELPEGFVDAIALATALDLDFGDRLAARAYYSERVRP